MVNVGGNGDLLWRLSQAGVVLNFYFHVASDLVSFHDDVPEANSFARAGVLHELVALGGIERNEANSSRFVGQESVKILR